MESVTIKVGGMTCGGCVSSVERVLKALDGVTNVEVSLANGEAKIQYERGRVQESDMRAAIEDAGFDAA